MTGAIEIGPKRIYFPGELWQGVFARTTTMQDAVSWADAFEIEPSGSDWLQLVRAQAPALLKLIPEPNAYNLWPGPTGFCGDDAPDMLDLDFGPLIGPLLDVDAPCGEQSEKAYTPLWDATAFMMRFAPLSPITLEVIGGARDAWTSRHQHDEDTLSASRARLLCNTIWEAYQAEATQVSLIVGPRVPFPYYWQGIDGVKTLNLRALDTSFDCRAVCSWPDLEVIRIEANVAPSVRAWLEAEVHAHRCDIRIAVVPAPLATPPDNSPRVRARLDALSLLPITDDAVQRYETAMGTPQHSPASTGEGSD